MTISDIEKKIDFYKNELEKLMKNHAQLVEIIEKHEAKIQEVRGAVKVLTELMIEEKEKESEIDESLKETFEEVDKAETITNANIRDITPTC